MRRLISANTSEILSYSANELKQSIKASEGRVILSENVAIHPAWIGDLTNTELAASFGADLILLNGVDVIKPNLANVEDQNDFVNELKKLAGRPIGVNLEPVDKNAAMMDEVIEISKGRTVNEKSLKALNKLGMDFVCLTGNPGTGVTNKSIAEAIKLTKEHFDGLIIAGKMHSSGVDEPVCDEETIKEFTKAGADVILVPSIGTIQGFDEEQLKLACNVAHQNGALVMTAIGTSQEGARPETIREMAIRNKLCGADIQHIGDAGFSGLAPVENIFEMSVAIRGMRHTVSRIARSVNR